MRSSRSENHNDASEARDHSGRRNAPRDLQWMLAITLVSALGLWRAWKVVRPFAKTAPHSAPQTAGCLTNLEHIGRGFALYASDWDGKFPRGKDAEDRAQPQIWRQAEYNQGSFYRAVMAAPLLTDLLQDYGVPRSAWHCPADVGWDTLPSDSVGPQSLRRVRPSAWQKYGMSYSYLTLFGLRQVRARDLKERAHTAVLLFDNTAWHGDTAHSEHRAGTLFADGTAQMVSASELSRLVNEDSPLDTP